MASLAAIADQRGGEIMSFRADGEPPLSELLGDSILHLLIKGDGISLDELRRVIDDFRAQRAGRRLPGKG